MVLTTFIRNIFFKFKRLFFNSKNFKEQTTLHSTLTNKFKLPREEFYKILHDLIIRPEDLYFCLDNIKHSDFRFAEYWNTRFDISLNSGLTIDHELEYDDDTFINRLKSAALTTVLNELNESYIELTSMRNYYFREVVEPCENYEKESSELFRKHFIQESNEDVKYRFQKVKDDIQTRYDEQNKSGIFSKVFRSTIGAVARLVFPDDFVREVVNRHIGNDDINQYFENLLIQLDNERLVGWIKKEKSLAESLKNQGGLTSFLKMSTASPEINEELSTATKVGGASVAAVAGSTAIIAAGWHTITWAMGGLFIWAMPAALIVTGIMSAINKESEHNKLMKSVDDTETEYLTRINEYMLYRIIPLVEEENSKLCIDIKKRNFTKRIGSFDPELLNQIIYKLEDYINLLRIKVDEVSGENNKILSSWLFKADFHLRDGDNITAAIVSSNAFEDFLHQLNIKFGLKFNFRQQSHNQVFIEYLGESGLISDEHRRMLHSLRERRNNFTHRIHLFSMWNRNRQIKEVTGFIDDINQLFNNYVKG